MSNFWVHLQKNFSGPLLSPNMKSHESRPNFHLHFSSAQTTEVPILLPFLENFDNLYKAFASASHTNNKKIQISFLISPYYHYLCQHCIIVAAKEETERKREHIAEKKLLLCGTKIQVEIMEVRKEILLSQFDFVWIGVFPILLSCTSNP